MVIEVGPDLETVLNQRAREQGVSPQQLAVAALRSQFLAARRSIEPRDEWERRLLAAASDCGVSLSNEAVSSEGLYD